MAIITSARRENYHFVVPGTESSDHISFNGGDIGQDEFRWVVIVGRGGNDILAPSPTKERLLQYSLYGDFNFGQDQNGIFDGPWARVRYHEDHVIRAGNDTLNFGQGAHHVKGGLSDPDNTTYQMGDFYIAHGQITSERGPLPELRWFDPEVGENDKVQFVRDNTERGGPFGYVVSKVQYDWVDEDTIRFKECIITGYTENELIVKQSFKLGFLTRTGQGGPGDEGDGHEVLLDVDDGDTPYITAREFLNENTRGGPAGTAADGYMDFIL